MTTPTLYNILYTISGTNNLLITLGSNVCLSGTTLTTGPLASALIGPGVTTYTSAGQATHICSGTNTASSSDGTITVSINWNGTFGGPSNFMVTYNGTILTGTDQGMTTLTSCTIDQRLSLVYSLACGASRNNILPTPPPPPTPSTSKGLPVWAWILIIVGIIILIIIIFLIIYLLVKPKKKTV